MLLPLPPPPCLFFGKLLRCYTSYVFATLLMLRLMPYYADAFHAMALDAFAYAFAARYCRRRRAAFDAAAFIAVFMLMPAPCAPDAADAAAAAADAAARLLPPRC